MQKILIVGSGDVARRILSRLARRYRVYAMLRDPGRCAEWRAAGALPVVADLDDRISQNTQSMIQLVSETADKTRAIVSDVGEASQYVDASARDLDAMVGAFRQTHQQLAEITEAMSQLRSENETIHSEVVSIRDHAVSISGKVGQCEQYAATLRDSTENLQGTLAEFRTGNSMFDTLQDKCGTFRDRVTKVLQGLADRGVDVFDQQYRDIPRSNPPRFTTSYDSACDQTLTALYDDVLRDLPGLNYSLAVDNRGYAPAHNSAVSQAPTGDPSVDLAKCRHKRIFNDPVGLRLAQNQKPSLFQTYVRDTGEVLNDLSMPIFINGRHWGAVRIGFKHELLN